MEGLGEGFGILSGRVSGDKIEEKSVGKGGKQEVRREVT